LHIKRVAISGRRRRELLSKRVNELKNRPCADCGGRFPPCAMDFDHVLGEKIDDVSGIRIDTGRWERVLAEIEKCELVCANCHRVRTHLGRTSPHANSVVQQKWFKDRYVSVLI